MRFEDIDPAAIPACWEWMRALLAPAIAQDGNETEEGVRLLLEEGVMHAVRLVEGGEGVVVYELSHKHQGPVLFLNYVAGRLEGGPKERLRKMRAVEHAFLVEARRLGCVEMRGGGRNWRRFLDGWEAQEGREIRKVI